jgi:large subunit ribosomal protein L18
MGLKVHGTGRAELTGGPMDKTSQKGSRRTRRKKHIRKRLFGTDGRPRLTVFRSLKHIYAQLIDDVAGRTLVEASTLSKELRESRGLGSNIKGAEQVGALLAQRAVLQGIRKVVFDRSGYKYHGRIKTLAEAARNGGLQF